MFLDHSSGNLDFSVPSGKRAASRHGTCCEKESSIPSRDQVRRKYQQPSVVRCAGGITPWRIGIQLHLQTSPSDRLSNILLGWIASQSHNGPNGARPLFWASREKKTSRIIMDICKNAFSEPSHVKFDKMFQSGLVQTSPVRQVLGSRVAFSFLHKLCLPYLKTN